MEENKRITLVLDKPNPLFEKWLLEWSEEAKRRGSKMERTFKYALINLSKYKIPLASGQECKILKGFGDKLCKMLDNKLAEYRTTKGSCSQTSSQTNSSNKKLKPSCAKTYVPQQGSGAYAILMALYISHPEEDYSFSLTKDDIINVGKQFSNTSFIKPDPGSYYTAWSSMKTVIEKGLVIKKGKPIMYSLTEKGYSVAKSITSLSRSTNEKAGVGIMNPLITNPSTQTTMSASDEIMSIVDDNLESGDFTQNVATEDFQIPKSDLKFELPSVELLRKITCQYSNQSTLSGNSCQMVTLLDNSTQNMSNTTKNKSLQKNFSADMALTSNRNMYKNGSKQIRKYSSICVIPSTNSSTQEDCFIFEGNSFDIILYVDTQETLGSNTDVQDDPLLSKLQNNSVLYEVKHLNIGDYVWICRHRKTKKELVLPYIIERKRLDDFASSIKDGRYHEQKFRLKKSGIQNVIYLIEHFSKHVSLPLSTLHQAAANTAIQDGFKVKFTTHLRHTAKYLTHFSNLLLTNFKDKTLVSCPKENLTDSVITDDLISLMTFKEFNKTSSKNKPLKVSELFIKMLLQIKGMSVEKACAVVEKYPSPISLKEAFDNNTPSEGEKLLAKVTFGRYNKMIGPLLSKTVYQLFSMGNF